MMAPGETDNDDEGGENELLTAHGSLQPVKIVFRAAKQHYLFSTN